MEEFPQHWRAGTYLTWPTFAMIVARCVRAFITAEVAFLADGSAIFLRDANKYSSRWGREGTAATLRRAKVLY
jgi:hypothetical protein